MKLFLFLVCHLFPHIIYSPLSIITFLYEVFSSYIILSLQFASCGGIVSYLTVVTFSFHPLGCRGLWEGEFLQTAGVFHIHTVLVFEISSPVTAYCLFHNSYQNVSFPWPWCGFWPATHLIYLMHVNLTFNWLICLYWERPLGVTHMFTAVCTVMLIYLVHVCQPCY